MKRKAIVTETVTYEIEFDVAADADDDTVEEAARDEWGSNSARDPDNYECDIEIVHIVSDESRSWGPRR